MLISLFCCILYKTSLHLFVFHDGRRWHELSIHVFVGFSDHRKHMYLNWLTPEEPVTQVQSARHKQAIQSACNVTDMSMYRSCPRNGNEIWIYRSETDGICSQFVIRSDLEFFFLKDLGTSLVCIRRRPQLHVDCWSVLCSIIASCPLTCVLFVELLPGNSAHNA